MLYYLLCLDKRRINYLIYSFFSVGLQLCKSAKCVAKKNYAAFRQVLFQTEPVHKALTGLRIQSLFKVPNSLVDDTAKNNFRPSINNKKKSPED